MTKPKNTVVWIDCDDIDIDGSEVTLDSPEPRGYLQWHYWARLQGRAGRKQVRCECCSRYRWLHLDMCRGCEEAAETDKQKEAHP